MRQKRADTVAAYLFLLPFLLLLAIFFGYAALRAVYFSFTDYDMFSAPRWVGLDNYRRLFQDTLFLSALRNSVLYSLMVTVTQTVLALVMAAVLDQRIRGISFFRSAYYMPSITSSVVITLIFLWMFQRRGVVNFLVESLLRYLPLVGAFAAFAAALQVVQVLWERRRGLPAAWGDPALAVVSLLVAAFATWGLRVTDVVSPRDVGTFDMVWLQTTDAVPSGWPFWLQVPVPLLAIIIQNVFTTVPTFMLMYLAAMQDVPRSQYEAAALDGAGPVQRFLYVTLPALRPVTFLVLTLGTIGTIKMFDQVAVFGSAAPLRSMVTLAYFVYDRMFPGASLPQVGFAAAAALFLALLTLLLVLVQRRFVRSEGV